MSEPLIFEFIQARMKQLGYKKYHIRYHDFHLGYGEHLVIPAHNELWFVVGEPEGVRIESDYGVYDTTGTPVSENIHQHRGEILVSNPNDGVRKVTFIRTIIVN